MRPLCLPIVLFLVVSATTARAVDPPLYVTPATAPAPLEESTTDNLDFLHTAPDHAVAKNNGARVLLSAAPRTFIAFWIPPDFAKQEARRTLVLLHPESGDAYVELRTALAAAAKNHYALLAIQWHTAPDEYLGPRAIYDLADRGLHHLAAHYRATPRAAALWATARAATYAYEVAYWDRKLNTNHFALVVANTGGLHPDRLSPLLHKIRDGDLGDDPLLNTHFFLYAATKAEPPDAPAPKLADQMTAARQILEDSGAKIEALVIDPTQKPDHFRPTSNPHATAAVQRFLDLTQRGAPLATQPTAE